MPFEKGSHKVTITEEERELLKTENYPSDAFWNTTMAIFLFGSGDAESVARIKAMPREDKNDLFLNKKEGEEWYEWCLDHELKRAILREEWKHNKK